MKIDQYESQFKSAVKDRYSYLEPEIKKVALITNEDDVVSQSLQDVCKSLLPSWAIPDWDIFSKDSFSTVKDLLEKINQAQPDLILCQRDIKTSDENLVYGLSDYTDAITQVTTIPVLLLPNYSLEEIQKNITPVQDVLVQTDHLTGDARLISWGAAFARPKGNLTLAHIEDDQVFKYYIDAIGKIPEIDTKLAETKIGQELVKLPTEYIADAKKVLCNQFKELTVSGIVKLGHSLADYKELLEDNRTQLLVMNTKVEGQLAMSGRAYALAVELKQIPLLLL